MHSQVIVLSCQKVQVKKNRKKSTLPPEFLKKSEKHPRTQKPDKLPPSTLQNRANYPLAGFDGGFGGGPYMSVSSLSFSLSLSISLPVAAHTFLRRSPPTPPSTNRRSPPTPPSAGRRPHLSQIHAMRARAARRSSAAAWGGATTGPLQRRRPAAMNCRASTLGAQAAVGLRGRGRATLPGDGHGVGGYGGRRSSANCNSGAWPAGVRQRRG